MAEKPRGADAAAEPTATSGTPRTLRKAGVCRHVKYQRVRWLHAAVSMPSVSHTPASVHAIVTSAIVRRSPARKVRDCSAASRAASVGGNLATAMARAAASDAASSSCEAAGESAAASGSRVSCENSSQESTDASEYSAS